jgi:hypothetical protein
MRTWRSLPNCWMK